MVSELTPGPPAGLLPASCQPLSCESALGCHPIQPGHRAWEPPQAHAAAGELPAALPLVPGGEAAAQRRIQGTVEKPLVTPTALSPLPEEANGALDGDSAHTALL